MGYKNYDHQDTGVDGAQDTGNEHEAWTDCEMRDARYGIQGMKYRQPCRLSDTR